MNSLKELIIETKVINSYRGLYGQDLYDGIKANKEGGIKFVDIALTQDEKLIDVTCKDISYIKKLYKDELCVGTGNVLTIEQLNKVAAAGANYIVCPTFDKDIILKAKQYGIFTIIGAFTPTEMQNAYMAGADMVMAFPTSSLPPNYLKNIIGNGPLNHLDLVACGGVNKDNLKEYLDMGFKAVVIGQYLADKELIKSKQLDEITKKAKEILEIARG